jgi:hypothetical protein
MTKKKSSKELPASRPATNPKDREDELINLAVGLAEQQLRDGTASTQVIVHYLKLGSTRGMLEQEMLENKTKLVKAQTESVQSNKRVEDLYKNALEAMKVYGGGGEPDDAEPFDV